jgi:glycosyltransferase involved in cell wall biosynthesis
VLLAQPASIDTVPTAPAATRPKLVFLVTEDWYFCSHRLPVARAARAAGFEVVVATRVREHGQQILREGFQLRRLGWQRGGDGVLGAGRALAEIVRLYRVERPDIVHHVALKPVLVGAAAMRLAFRRGKGPVCIAAINGLGSGLRPGRFLARLGEPVLRRALRWAAGVGRIIVQNPEDGAALIGLGVDAERVALIRGSGVDTAHFRPLPDPPGLPVRVALVARMLRSKGVLDAVAAVRRLRAQGLAVELLLAGPTDPDNADSLDEAALRGLAEPGIEWLGRVGDVREVWRRSAIAVFPSTYGEGVPKALLEAAACGRPIVAADMPGCREVVRPGETGILTSPRDVAALSEAIAALAGDPARRRRMGAAARALAEREFGEAAVAERTLALYRAALAEPRDGR